MRADDRRLLYPLVAAIVIAYYLFFTWRSVGLYFDSDDMTNLYFVWIKPWGEILRANVFYWSDFYRPMGGLFYRAMFAVAGFNPLPFRLVCLAIGIVNIGLCFWFVKLISGSDRVAALAILIFAFQPRLLEVWYRTGVIYDLLCFTFFYLAACLYIGARRKDESLGVWRIGTITLCYILALDSKEMAVALPVILLAWELLFGRGKWTRLWMVSLLSLMTLPYLYGKTHGSSLLANNPFYRAEYSWNRFSHSWALYLNYIFVRENIPPWSAMAILMLLLAFAVAVRSRILGIAWVVVFFGTLPVSFIPYRGGFVLYLAWAGWVLYAATVLVDLQDLALKYWPMHRFVFGSIIFLLVGWRLGKLNLHEQRKDPRRWMFDSPDAVRAFATQMDRLQPTLPHGARLLFLEDGFGADEWTPLFILRLSRHDETMVADRIKMMNTKTQDWNNYQFVFSYDHGAYKQRMP